MLSKTEEGQPFAVALAEQLLGVSLLEEGKESCRVFEVFGYDVRECWCVVCCPLGFVPLLCVNTRSGSARGGFCGLAVEREYGYVRLWGGFLVLKLLQGFSVYFIRGWQFSGGECGRGW
jgi:hypothetical protein